MSSIYSFLHFPYPLFILPSILDATAQIAAGNQPINVICKITHIIPEIILPLKKKDNQGSNTAINIIF